MAKKKKRKVLALSNVHPRVRRKRIRSRKVKKTVTVP